MFLATTTVEGLRPFRSGVLHQGCREEQAARLEGRYGVPPAGHRVEKRPREVPAGLTDRELEVLLALAAGKTNKQIAVSLGISAKTVGTTCSTPLTRRARAPGPQPQSDEHHLVQPACGRRLNTDPAAPVEK